MRLKFASNSFCIMLHSVSRSLSAPPQSAYAEQTPLGIRLPSFPLARPASIHRPRLRRAPSAPRPRRRPRLLAPPCPRRAPLLADRELRRPRASPATSPVGSSSAPPRSLAHGLRAPLAPRPHRRPRPLAPPRPRRVLLLADRELRRSRAPPCSPARGPRASPDLRPAGDLVRRFRLAPAASFIFSNTGWVEVANAPPCSLLASQEAGGGGGGGDGRCSSLFPARRSRGGTAAAARGEVAVRLPARAAGGRWVGEGPVVSGRTSGISGIPEPEPEIAGTRIVG